MPRHDIQSNVLQNHRHELLSSLCIVFKHKCNYIKAEFNIIYVFTIRVINRRRGGPDYTLQTSFLMGTSHLLWCNLVFCNAFGNPLNVLKFHIYPRKLLIPNFINLIIFIHKILFTLNPSPLTDLLRSFTLYHSCNNFLDVVFDLWGWKRHSLKLARLRCCTINI